MFQSLPVIPLRGMVVLPGEIVHCDAGRKKTLAAIQAAASADGVAFFCTQKDANVQEPGVDDLEQTGTICEIKQVFRIQGDGIHMLVTGLSRARVESIISETPYFEASVFELEAAFGDGTTEEALKRRIQEGFAEFARLNGGLTSGQRSATLSIEDAGKFADAVAALVISDAPNRQRLLEETNIQQRLSLLLSLLNKELEISRLDYDIAKRLQAELEKNQKEHFLREKIKVIRKELGEDEQTEADEYNARMKEKQLPEAVAERLKKEIGRLAVLPMGSHETPIARNYIECLLELPWAEQTEDNLDLDYARKILDSNHYGMEKVKDRVIEYLAVQKLTSKPNGQILCFVGPPGVGKTSIVESIAKAMGRNFVRMSLGGIRDEAEIRGHRRTYIGAMPGRVISAMRQAGSTNPVLLFDEIDKLASDFKGDPAAAMLEVLDGAQNFAFRDHYLELPYDLSKAMLLTTANDEQTIPKPVLDRMEVIHVQSYLDCEKLQIAKRHLLAKQLEAHGLKKSNLRIADEEILAIINGYTREAGVRELERMLAAVCRKAACQIARGRKTITLTPKKRLEFLGKPRYHEDYKREKSEVGVVTGLAWTPAGGETLSIEAAVTKGSGIVQLTGHLGDVMQESGKAAMTYVRAHAEEWGLDPTALTKLDIHLHVPQGAVPKDGPSAGVAMAAAILSALTHTPARADIAMTGEITLRGKVLPIGGVREKSLAALRAGLTCVLLPEGNRKDIEEIPESARNALDFRFMETLEQVFDETLCALPLRKAVPYYTADKWQQAVHGEGMQA